MARTLGYKRLHRLDIQGFERIDEGRLTEVAPWLRLAFGLCAALAALGTALASPKVLLVLTAVAFTAALSPVHPFDLIYNHGIRRATGTRPLPKRGVPSRFACGLGSVWLIFTAWAFFGGLTPLGYASGAVLTSVALLVATADICIPSMIFRALFGGPAPRR